MANIKSPMDSSWKDSAPKTGDGNVEDNPLMGPDCDNAPKLPLSFGDDMHKTPQTDNTPFNDAWVKSMNWGNHKDYSPESAVTSPFKDVVKK